MDNAAPSKEQWESLSMPLSRMVLRICPENQSCSALGLWWSLPGLRILPQFVKSNSITAVSDHLNKYWEHFFPAFICSQRTFLGSLKLLKFNYSSVTMCSVLLLYWNVDLINIHHFPDCCICWLSSNYWGFGDVWWENYLLSSQSPRMVWFGKDLEDQIHGQRHLLLEWRGRTTSIRT